jgi:hypothetical protein
MALEKARDILHRSLVGEKSPLHSPTPTVGFERNGLFSSFH